MWGDVLISFLGPCHNTTWSPWALQIGVRSKTLTPSKHRWRRWRTAFFQLLFEQLCSSYLKSPQTPWTRCLRWTNLMSRVVARTANFNCRYRNMSGQIKLAPPFIWVLNEFTRQVLPIKVGSFPCLGCSKKLTWKAEQKERCFCFFQLHMQWIADTFRIQYFNWYAKLHFYEADFLSDETEKHDVTDATDIQSEPGSKASAVTLDSHFGLFV